eukprot:CAMPEP_0179140406 /NCGR_PEP_ID=MMETSP0796-20121207/67226_1 /TAXON_ID=73915 /ORGANISM="Pyrodinium bahamense, Strain pbaha01" /LENGTH=160 /DNA_ID=CAMNT_0020839941 /DNA_START=24 /DNA_END=507 /DNA_ORIENTATION=-
MSATLGAFTLCEYSCRQEEGGVRATALPRRLHKSASGWLAAALALQPRAPTAALLESKLPPQHTAADGLLPSDGRGREASMKRPARKAGSCTGCALRLYPEPRKPVVSAGGEAGREGWAGARGANGSTTALAAAGAAAMERASLDQRRYLCCKRWRASLS